MPMKETLVVTLTVDELRALIAEEIRKAVAPPESDVLTRETVAKMLKVTERTVVGYVERFQLPASRLPNGWRFFRSDVVAWMKGRIEQTPTRKAVR